MGKVVAGSTVDFDELAGSPKGSFGRESRSLTREGRINWASIDTLIAECFPDPPLIWGVHPTISYLYIESLEIEPFHPDAGNWLVCTGDAATYTAPNSAGKEAKVTAKYSLLPFPDASQLISVKFSVGGEFMMIAPTSDIVWEDTGNKVTSQDSKIGKFIPTIEHSYSRQRATSIPWSAIRSCIGKINSATLSAYPFPSVGKETLLFAGAEIGFTLDTKGKTQYTLDYRFHERIVTHPNVHDGPAGWNHIYREIGDTWVRVKSSSGAIVQYETTGAFSTLFT